MLKLISTYALSIAGTAPSAAAAAAAATAVAASVPRKKVRRKVTVTHGSLG